MDTLGKDIFKHCEKELGCFPHEETVLDRHITLLLLALQVRFLLPAISHAKSGRPLSW